MNVTYELLLREGSKQLKEAGISEADLDAWYLLAECFGIGIK